MKIPFFKSTFTGDEPEVFQQLFKAPDSFAKKEFTAKCEKWFVENHGLKNLYLTKSCTDSLELAALVLGIKESDEVILPSYSFVACGNAFALRGAKCVFVDIHPDTMNIDETKVETAVTPKTKAILTLNYASISCNYEALRKIARKHNLFILEDNAHGILAKDEQKNYLGTFGDISTFSFDHLKNVTCGQGGGIAINNEKLLKNFFVHYEFGTNRRSFFKGESNRYEWKNIGSNYPISELNAAMLFVQLQRAHEINSRFLKLWDLFHDELYELHIKRKIKLPVLPKGVHHNAHIFFIKTNSANERNDLLEFLLQKGIGAQFHYTPLHISEFGKQAGIFSGKDVYTSEESKKLLRLPLFFGMTEEEVKYVVECLKNFYLK